MGTTASGIVYPSSGDNVQLWAHLQTLAESIQTLLDNSYESTWATYVPVVTGHGTATFSTLSGYWRYIGPKLVFVNVSMIASVAGSGAATITFTLPTNPNRTNQQTILVHAGGIDSAAAVATGAAVIFIGGSGAVVDRVRCQDGTTANALPNITGARITSSANINVQGIYREA